MVGSVNSHYNKRKKKNMARETSGRIKKYGVCLNSGCAQYKQIQEIVHGDMECPECKKKLSPCAPPKPKKNTKLPLIAGGAVVAVAAVVGGILAFTGGETSPKVPITTTVVDTAATRQPATVTVVKTDTVKQVDTVTVEKRVEVAAKPKTTPVKTTAPAGNANYGTVNLGYGRYTGDLKNGKPHGHGTITYTATHRIVSSKDYTASAGDTFEGDFREGKVSGNIGYWKHGGEMTPVKP